MLVKVANNLQEDAPKTALSNAEVAGTTVLRVRNTAAMTTSWAVQIGEIGQERSEVVIGTASGSGTINCATTSFEHPADTSIYFIKYNQVVFEKSTSGTAGTATPIASGTVSYQADGTVTVFDDGAGASGDAYRARFRNSVLGSNTAQSDWITPGGFSFYSLARLRDRIRNKLWSSAYLTDAVIDDWVNEWKDEMTNAVISVNEDYALGTVDVAFDGTDGYGTITTTDFKQVRRVWVTYNGQSFFQSTKMNINDFVPDQVFSSAHPFHTWLGNTVFQVRPDESGGTARMVFYRLGTTMVNDTDELPLPMRGYTKSFTDYSLSQAFLKDGKIEEYQSKLAEANGAKSQFVKELVPRDKSGPTLVDLVEPIAGEQYAPR